MSMSFHSFEEKIKKLNPKIYIDKAHRVFTVNKELGTSGIYLKDFNSFNESTFGLSGEDKLIVEKMNAEQDEMIGWTTHDIVYEADQFDESGKIIATGWRSILKRFVKSGYVDADKARQVFGWEESDYDRLTYEQKRDLCLQQRLATQEMN